jgi:hypothetical protein
VESLQLPVLRSSCHSRPYRTLANCQLNHNAISSQPPLHSSTKLPIFNQLNCPISLFCNNTAPTTSKTPFLYCYMRVHLRGNLFSQPLLRNGLLFIRLLHSKGCTRCLLRGLCLATGIYATLLMKLITLCDGHAHQISAFPFSIYIFSGYFSVWATCIQIYIPILLQQIEDEASGKLKLPTFDNSSIILGTHWASVYHSDGKGSPENRPYILNLYSTRGWALVICFALSSPGAYAYKHTYFSLTLN